MTVDDALLPLTFVACHCLNCHTTAGSPFSMVAVAELDKISIQGEPKGCECGLSWWGWCTCAHPLVLPRP